MKRWSEAQGALAEAERLARLLNRNRDLAEIMLLRSLAPEGAPPNAGETLGAIEPQDLIQLASDLGAPLTGVAVEAPASAPHPQPALTPAEVDVMELLGQGLSNKAIARALCLGDETVKWHLRNIYQKVDAHDRGKAVQRARELGLLA
jgi:LuxR family maltose regulon positive regulatory protein